MVRIIFMLLVLISINGYAQTMSVDAKLNLGSFNSISFSNSYVNNYKGYHIKFNDGKKRFNYAAFSYGMDLSLRYDISRFSVGAGIGLYIVLPGKAPITYYKLNGLPITNSGYLAVEEIAVNIPLDFTYRFVDKYQSFYAIGGVNIALGNISNSYHLMDLNENYIASDVLDYSDLFKNEISHLQMKYGIGYTWGGASLYAVLLQRLRKFNSQFFGTNLSFQIGGSLNLILDRYTSEKKYINLD